ncbi:MAG: hypothetical protein A2W31_09475 [Planctomycetes bacterium RBG_16_64_10]|nr:MAG: hypothetical protein A2W31_09475 [Planctomycetes bacterium RBG_16_64_10]
MAQPIGGYPLQDGRRGATIGSKIGLATGGQTGHYFRPIRHREALVKLAGTDSVGGPQQFALAKVVEGCA